MAVDTQHIARKYGEEMDEFRRDAEETLREIYRVGGSKVLMRYIAKNYGILQDFGVLLRDDKLNAIHVRDESVTFYLDSVFIIVEVYMRPARFCTPLMRLDDNHELCARIELNADCSCNCDCGGY
ncbi:MAG: hypothetical protein F7C35_08275 [Desulfurococcales archaeon]|nr:hypothetical protein [Desulfurococcales archaeon]